jgi:alkylation response protein AidB-like acyl-CoA dehydrogenase
MPEATPHPALPRKGGGDSSNTASSSPSPLAGEGRGGGFAPTAKQRDLLTIAERLGRENFAPRAARYDREASFPFENYADLKAAKLTALCIPESEGGLGADFPTYCLVSAELGRWSARPRSPSTCMSRRRCGPGRSPTIST